MRAISALLLSTTVLLTTGCGPSGPREALGTLERDRIVLKATADEIITAEPVTEGRHIERGTLLVQLDSRRQQARVARATAELAQAEAELEQLRNGAREEDIATARARLSGARANYDQAAKDYARAVSLVKQKLASQSQLDQAIAKRDATAAALESASEQLLMLTNGTRREELDRGEARVEAAKAQLQLEQLALNDLSVTATRDAYLDSLPWNVGERVPAGATVAILLAEQAPFARVYVPEPWRTRLNVGDTLQVKVDGVDEPFSGRLRWIANDPAFTPYYALNTRDRARLVYLAEVELDDGAALPTGLPVQMRLPEQ